LAFRKSALESVEMNPEFWRKTKVLLTGHTGFKGSWLALWLSRLGANVHGLALPAEYAQGLFARAELGRLICHRDGDLLCKDGLEDAVEESDPDVVFHLAALIGIPYSYLAPQDYVRVNVQGTLNVLEACRAEGVEKLVAYMQEFRAKH
jgi:nucleoside-diphosphate-sugar epimerase